MTELSEEEVFENDKDPLAAIREIRREEGVAEEDLPIVESDTSSEEVKPDIPEEGKDELDNLEDKKDTEDLPVVEDTDKTTDEIPTEEEPGEDPGETTSEKDESDKTSVDDVTDTKSTVDKKKFTANGQEFEFTQDEILEQFEVVFGQAMDYTQKTQKMAPYRKMISALETEDITADQLNLAIDALKGNKQALQTMMENNKIDAYDLTNDEDDEGKEYTPTEYGKNEVQLDIEDVSNRISSDPEYQITVDVIDKQWDQNSRNQLSSNPSMIEGLHNDIKSGIYDKVAPVAMKMKVLDGNTKSDIEYYMLAGEKVIAAEKQNSGKPEKTVADMNKNTQDAENEFDQASSEAQQKRSASPTRTRADRKGVIDYLDDDDESYDAWYKNLMASN